MEVDGGWTYIKYYAGNFFDSSPNIYTRMTKISLKYSPLSYRRYICDWKILCLHPRNGGIELLMAPIPYVFSG